MASLNAIAPIGIVLGAVLGLGLWLIVSAVPRVGRPRLVERVAPYVADLSAEARAMLARASFLASSREWWHRSARECRSAGRSPSFATGSTMQR